MAEGDNTDKSDKEIGDRSAEIPNPNLNSSSGGPVSVPVPVPTGDQSPPAALCLIRSVGDAAAGALMGSVFGYGEPSLSLSLCCIFKPY